MARTKKAFYSFKMGSQKEMEFHDEVADRFSREYLLNMGSIVCVVHAYALDYDVLNDIIVNHLFDDAGGHDALDAADPIDDGLVPAPGDPVDADDPIDADPVPADHADPIDDGLVPAPGDPVDADHPIDADPVPADHDVADPGVGAPFGIHLSRWWLKIHHHFGIAPEGEVPGWMVNWQHILTFMTVALEHMGKDVNFSCDEELDQPFLYISRGTVTDFGKIFVNSIGEAPLADWAQRYGEDEDGPTTLWENLVKDVHEFLHLGSCKLFFYDQANSFPRVFFHDGPQRLLVVMGFRYKPPSDMEVERLKQGSSRDETEYCDPVFAQSEGWMGIWDPQDGQDGL